VGLTQEDLPVMSEMGANAKWPKPLAAPKRTGQGMLIFCKSKRVLTASRANTVSMSVRAGATRP
jgi:hypothetical protein